MSATINVGIYPSEYWVFMARSMSIRLKAIIRARRIESDSIPAGVYYDACKYFEMVEEAASEAGYAAPTRSNAAEPDEGVGARRSPRRANRSESKVFERMGRHRKFVVSLANPRDLDDDDIREAKSLIKFFVKLAEDGEAERYHESVSLSIPGVTVRGVTMRNGRLIHS